MIIFKIWTIATGIFLLFLCWRTRRFTRFLASLEKQTILHAEPWPKISVIVPARNEECTIEQALASLKEVHYPNLEIVLVNDRSTDKTGKIMERMGAADPRIKVVHIDHLPPGWLGKVHAMEKGIAQTDSEWILLTDADVHFSEKSIYKAISYCRKHKLDFLTAIPDLFTRTLGLQVMMSQLYHQASLFFDPRKLNDPDSRACYGQGAFLLFKRETYAKSMGLEWLKMEIVDDTGLALLLRKAGARMGAVAGQNEIKLEWYPTLKCMIKGLEKNGFAMCSYSIFPLLAFMVMSWIIFGGFMVSPLLTHNSFYEVFSFVCLVFYLVAVTLQLRKLMKIKIYGILMFPIAFLLLPLIFIRAAIFAILRGGVHWRGTFYSLHDLKRSQRMKLVDLVFAKSLTKRKSS